MGQKVNPNGIRLGINKTWSSRWYSKSDYSKLLHEDLSIKKYVMEKLKSASISKITIEREAKKLRLAIYSSRPGTPASNKKLNQLDENKKRLKRLQDILNKLQHDLSKKLIDSY